MNARLAFLAATLLAPAAALAQTSPFLPDPLYRQLVNEISGDRSYENVRHLSHYHRTGGSRDFFAAAEWIRQAAEAAELEDVKLIRQKWNRKGWSCSSGEAWLVEPQELKLAAYGDVRVSIADNSRTTHVSAELVDVGGGTTEADYKDKEVKDKIVLAAGAPSAAHREAVWKRGALGVISYHTNRPEAIDAPDQVAWSNIPQEAKDVEGVKDGTPGTFAVLLSPRRGIWLKKQMAERGGTFKMKVDIEASLQEQGEQAMVEAWIRGSEIHDQQVLLTAHIQEEMTSANDDGSGCGNLLEIGRALTRLIREGKLPRPRRDIRFWWVNEFSSQEQLFRENPTEPRRMLVNINQDMVGARQSFGGRVQYASRLPWSLPHALDDVMENVLAAVRDGNTSLLITRGTKAPQPFTREVTAVKGSREPFHARMVPYYDSTDHHAFTPARIGVPGTSLTNWPDEFIHSTGDDLENIDATQLERNAVVAAGVALYFASAGDEEAPALAAYVAARGRARAAADAATAAAHVAQAAPAAQEAAFRAARNLVLQSYRKEAAALASLRRLSPKGRAADLVSHALSRLESAQGLDIAGLERAYTAITGKNPPNVEPSRDEREMMTKVFVPVADIGAVEDALDKVKPVEGLHAMMRFEVYNFADGRRSAFEVYEAVAAEALSAGEWYYGTVKPADVLETLERAASAGAYTVSRSDEESMMRIQLLAGALVAAIVLPAAAGAASDPKAVALADRVMNALGGQQAWAATRYLRFDFAVESAGKLVVSRAHTWDKGTGRYRLEGKDKAGQPYLVVMNLHTKAGSAWRAGQHLSGDEEKKQLEDAYATWVNDTYWLLMPYKLKDPGVNLAYDGEEKSEGHEWEKLLLTFENVGLTPKDRYWVYVNKKTHLVDRWDYILEGGPGPATTFLWKGWKSYGRVELAPERVDPKKGTRIFFPVLEAPESVPEASFAPPVETR